jgi:hypothetical protein
VWCDSSDGDVVELGLVVMVGSEIEIAANKL